MPKPIFLVGFPKTASISEFRKASETLEEKLSKDYYVLVFPQGKDTEITFDIKSVEDINDQKFEDLKEIVKTLINEYKKLD